MNGAMATPPTRRSSTYPTNSGLPSPLARRSSTIPSPSLLSPFNSSANGGTPNSYSSSIAPSQYLDGGRRFSTYSVSGAASNAGSMSSNVTTTASKFKRGHMRKKATPVLQATLNPDDLDLNNLTDPDDLFRMFGVREVRGLEKRAKDAAATKVSDLRTMVGERYRDLLSAADSIVRMRLSAEKLVEKLDRVGAAVGGTGGDSPSKRGATQLAIKRSTSPEPDRTLQSPATLSLTIHLFLSLPSLVHTLLESSSFLPAARLEGVGRVVHRELSTFPFGDDEEEGALKTAFPIVERQWEIVGSLGSAITRRATSELQIWGASSITTAETLAAILMIDNAALPSTLSLLLEARSKSLTGVLNSSLKSKHSHDITEVLAHLSDALGIVLRTVEIANEIFTPSKLYPEGILSQLLRQIENPTPVPSSSTSITSPSLDLSPTLSSLPNYPLLLRHLSPSILDFTPFLSIDSPRNILTPANAENQISTWLTKETARVVKGVTSWISDLKGGARTLAKVRAAVRSGFTSSTSTTSSSSSDLLVQLEGVIESRLEAVYQTHLTTLVERVSPCLRSLLKSLPDSKSDSDPAYFLFEESLPFPSPAHYALPTRVVQHGIDPFDAFLEKVNKRVEGCSPLIVRGLGELEAHARDLREDLEGWLGGSVEGEVVGVKLRMKDQYVQSAKDSFDGVYRALSEVLNEVATDVTAAIFIAHFIFKLSQSETFTRDLLLGSASIVESKAGSVTAEWESRLTELQTRSLLAWRKEAIGNATAAIQDSIKTIASSPNTLASWSWDATRTSGANVTLPAQPSSFVLLAFKELSTAVRKIGPTRLEADIEIVVILLAEFQSRCLELSEDLLKAIQALVGSDKNDVAIQSLWDLVFLKRFFECGKEKEWKVVEDQLLEIIDGDTATMTSRIEQAALHYLQRTQTIFFPLLIPLKINDEFSESSDISRMLPWGAPPSGYEFKSSVGVVIPKARLGLLRE